MVQSQWLRRLALVGALAAGYFVAGKLGLRVAFVNPSATPVWPPTGIALVGFVLLGYDVWPAVLLSAFLVNLATAGAAIVSLGGLARWADFGSIWATWWLGDAVGDLVVAPAVLLWSMHPRVHWRRRQTLEAAALLLCVIVVGLVVFGGLYPSDVKNYPLEFLCVPFLVWAAFRFAPRGAAAAVVVLSAVAIAGTLRGFGPFARATPNESLLLLQAFMGVMALMTLVLAAVVAERKEGEERLRRLAVSDPLTGLGNYRELVSALAAEIGRSDRTDRPFAVVLLDLDGLKAINDRYGHMVGSMALRRVAEMLPASCRRMDTAARFGGDEFALVLPETGEAAAWLVARRITDRVARDGETPAISVSAGVAVHPRDGATLEALVNSADRALYESKARRRDAGRVGSLSGGGPEAFPAR